MWVVRCRVAPASRVRAVGREVSGYTSALEEPEGQSGVIPQHGVHASACAGKVRAITRGRNLDDAPLVEVRLVEAVRRNEIPGLEGLYACGGVRAAVECVEGNIVLDLEVHTFHDIDFTVVWPSGTLGPEGGPHGAAKWHVYGIEEEKIPRRYRVVGQNLDTRPQKGRVPNTTSCVVHLDDGIPRRVQ